MSQSKLSATLLTLAVASCVAPVAAPPAPPAVVAGAATGTATVDENRAALVKYARNHEYRSFLRDGKLLWCRKETTIGTRFAHTTCVSDETLAELYHQSLLNEDSLQRSQACNNATCESRN